MTTEELLVQLYTLPVHTHDIVVLRRAAPSSPEAAEACAQTLRTMLRLRGQDNAVVVLHPDMTLSTARQPSTKEHTHGHDPDPAQ